MPRFHPFSGLRYAATDGRLDAVIAPPYDVISPDEQARLMGSSDHNAVRIELPMPDDGPGGGDRYQAAARIWAEWQGSGVICLDPEPSFYLYRMGFEDESGNPRQTAGVIGALELSPPGQDGIVPHERTTSKDKADRLELLRACRANLSPIWGLSTAEGLSALCEPTGPPDARATDDEGVHHRLWRVSQPGVVEAIESLVASASLVIADGHHRYETALTYRDEVRHATGGAPGPHDAVMAYVVELSDEQLDVRPIHRLIAGLPAGLDLPAALAEHFAVSPTAPPDTTMAARMDTAGALALVTTDGTWLLEPLPATEGAAGHDLDSSRLDVALAALGDPGPEVRFQHGVANVVAAVATGAAQAGVLLRPATVAQIAAVGAGGERMPPKTTFFNPKPRTGMVFRTLS